MCKVSTTCIKTQIRSNILKKEIKFEETFHGSKIGRHTSMRKINSFNEVCKGSYTKARHMYKLYKTHIKGQKW